jgi:transmembrane sensor
MTESIVRTLLNDFFDGNSTSVQRKMIEEWLSKETNRELFYQCLDEWEREHPQFTPNHDRALSIFNSVIKNDESVSPPVSIYGSPDSMPWFRGSIWMKAAAIFIVVLIAGIPFRNQIFYKTLQSDPGSTTAYTLNEGTRVLLNSNSTLTVPRFGFKKGNREVFLEGEAEFNVTHTENNDRFIVNMENNYKIEVLGTEFVAFSRARGKRVFLKQGKVKIQLPQGQQLYMKPGNLFVTNGSNDFKMTEKADPKPYVSWKQQSFYFDNTRMADVAIQIEEYFNVNVSVLDSTLANRRIAGIYKAEQLDDLLQILSELMQIQIIQKDDRIELSTPKSQLPNLKPKK